MNLSTTPLLVIDKIDYMQLPSPGGGIILPPRYEFRITVRNVGSADFKDAFYVAHTSSMEEFEEGVLGRFLLVNEEKRAILKGESIILKFQESISVGVSRVTFAVQGNRYNLHIAEN